MYQESVNLDIEYRFMSTAELKIKLLEKLESVNEPHLIEEMLGFLDIESKEVVVKIPSHFKERLQTSIAQKEAGNTIPNAEVEKTIEAWLYK